MSTGKKKPASSKLSLALYWAASCGGCEVGLLDVDEKILDIVAAADIVFWPVAIDTKYKDVEAMADGSIDVCLFNGGIRTSENEHLARLLRRKSKVLVAFGSCAVTGGVPGLANLSTKEAMLKTVYLQNPSLDNDKKTLPEPETTVNEGILSIPQLHETVRSLDQVVDVDYYIPGCPPPVALILDAFNAIVEDRLPPKGSVLAPLRSVCDECRFRKSDKKLTAVKRIYELETIEEKCFLEQGVVCMGPATLSGCSGRCMDALMPCTGCGGLLPGALDQGASAIAALASLLGIDTEQGTSDEALDTILDGLPDLAGTFYKYTLPKALLSKRRSP